MEDRVIPLDSTPPVEPPQLSDAQVITQAWAMIEARHGAERQTLNEAQGRDIQAFVRAVEKADRAVEGKEHAQLSQIAERRVDAAGSRLKMAFYAVTGAGRDKALETKITDGIEGRRQQQQKALSGLRYAHEQRSQTMNDAQFTEKRNLERGGAAAAREYVRQHSRTEQSRSLQQSHERGPDRSRSRDDGTMYRLRQNDPALAAYRAEQRGPAWDSYVPLMHADHSGIWSYTQDGIGSQSGGQGGGYGSSGEPSGNPYRVSPPSRAYP